MPENAKDLPQEIYEDLSGLCPDCFNTGSLVCNNHGVAVSAASRGGGSSRSELGKRLSDLVSSKARRCRNMEHAANTSQPSPKKRSRALAAGMNESPAPDAQSSNDISSIQMREEDQAPEADVSGPVGGVRYRSKLKKYVVEHRPSKFKWKLWMGTYTELKQGMRVIDAAKFYTGQENGKFYLPDSPAIFREQGPLPRPFELISKEVKDKQFNLDVKRRAKAAVRKDILACKLARETVQQVTISSVVDVERGLFQAAVPSIDLETIPAILTPATTLTDLRVLSNLENCDEYDLEEWSLCEENQEGDVVEDVVSSSENLVPAQDDDPCEVMDQWLYPGAEACCSEVHGLFPSYYQVSFELDFDNRELGDHNLRSSLDYIQSGDDLQECDIELWDLGC